MELWEWSLSNVKDNEMKARIRGVQTVMESFDFVFCCSLSQTILRQTDNLSKTLQHSHRSVAQGQELASLAVKTLSKDRNTEMLDNFWTNTTKRAKSLATSDPSLPRKRKITDHFGKNGGSQESHYFLKTPEERYRAIYFEVYDTTINCIKQRFDQPDYRTYIHLQETLLKAVTSGDWQKHLDEVCDFYGDDINKYAAETQLKNLSEMAMSEGFNPDSSFAIKELIKFLQALPEAKKLLIKEVAKIAKIMLVMPATNALSERSFPALQRLKTYLRSTTTISRLKNMLTLHIHKDETDNLGLCNVANEFILLGDRKTLFGCF